MTMKRVKSIMRTKVPFLTPDTPIRRAAALLVESRAAAAPVVDDDDRMAGLLTQKDCFRSALHASYYREWKGNVSDHMTREVISVEPDDELILVAEMFMSHPHRVFPVLDTKQVLGLVHRSDVLAELIHLG
ncbi:CBS domain-containing protein [Marivita sp. XM-24bin2]|uniref:CBS domain-containing protein n=1 Tax=unclassified Marivita TaxID=2632480 RepID=UPI000D7947DA|nr:CBS domain-containing protein [Marivita sp. XM-24bin2]MCR9110678.1 CBS domain-containing protein [Paracoccaceae bacterium]PWL33770.1 MAG: CBS domain-containing protein [Marivita sp. XM-24bin2]